MPNCKRCGVSATGRTDWGRYERNSRLKVLCPECDATCVAEREESRKRNEAAAAAGYRRGWASTPEAHRIQRERDAARHGRTLVAYVPQAERERLGRLVAAERQADQLRARWIRDWLAQFRSALYRNDPLYREEQKAHYRDHYRRHRQSEVARVCAYKREHSERNLEWTATRKDREAALADGTVTPEVIARLKAEATHCAYCGGALTEKQTDHMIPLVLGGEHSIRNIVIVCPSCNGRKARLSYPDWIERVSQEHRERVVALYRGRYGNALAA